LTRTISTVFLGGQSTPAHTRCHDFELVPVTLEFCLRFSISSVSKIAAMVFHGIALLFVPLSGWIHSTGMIFLLRYPSCHFQFLPLRPGNRATLSDQTTLQQNACLKKKAVGLAEIFSCWFFFIWNSRFHRSRFKDRDIYSRSTVFMRSCKGWFSALFMRFTRSCFSVHSPFPLVPCLS
jgi:hypothetical protein